MNIASILVKKPKNNVLKNLIFLNVKLLIENAISELLTFKF